MELTPTELELGPEIEEIITSMQTQINDKTIKMLLAIPKEICPVLADKLRLAQVMSNLLSNACKFSLEGA